MLKKTKKKTVKTRTKKTFSKPKKVKVALVAVGNTRIRHGISKAETIWLDKLHVPERSKVIYGFHGKILIVDGFNYNTKTVYEYLGASFHGSHTIPHKDRNIPDPWLKKSPNQLYSETKARFQFLFDLGFKVFFVWDFQDKKGKLGRYYQGTQDTLY